MTLCQIMNSTASWDVTKIFSRHMFIQKHCPCKASKFCLSLTCMSLPLLHPYIPCAFHMRQLRSLLIYIASIMLALDAEGKLMLLQPPSIGQDCGHGAAAGQTADGFLRKNAIMERVGMRERKSVVEERKRLDWRMNVTHHLLFTLFSFP